MPSWVVGAPGVDDGDCGAPWRNCFHQSPGSASPGGLVVVVVRSTAPVVVVTGDRLPAGFVVDVVDGSADMGTRVPISPPGGAVWPDGGSESGP